MSVSTGEGTKLGQVPPVEDLSQNLGSCWQSPVHTWILQKMKGTTAGEQTARWVWPLPWLCLENSERWAFGLEETANCWWQWASVTGGCCLDLVCHRERCHSPVPTVWKVCVSNISDRLQIIQVCRWNYDYLGLSHRRVWGGVEPQPELCLDWSTQWALFQCRPQVTLEARLPSSFWVPFWHLLFLAIFAFHSWSHLVNQVEVELWQLIQGFGKISPGKSWAAEI